MEEWIRHVLGSGEITAAVLAAAFLLGLLATLSSTCNIAALSAIAGYSATRETSGRRDTLLAGLSFMVGAVIALAAIGAVAGFVSRIAGDALGRYWRIFAGAVAVLFGLTALKLVPFKLPTPSLARKSETPSAGLFPAAVFGLVVGGSATACSTGCNPLLAVPLGVAALQGDVLRGAALLGAFALGFSSPLAAIFLGLSVGRRAIKAERAAAAVRIVGGILLTAVGFYLLATL